MTEQNKVRDNKDRQYFTITPRLVGLLCESVYEYTLWGIIKEIAGEEGECYLSTPDLAILAMQSTGKVSQARQRLVDIGLLEGEIRRDPGYQQPVWHLRIPDLWPQNIALVQDMPGIKDRVEFKRRQKSFHVVKASPGEEAISPHEEATPPGETKKNHKEEPKGKPSDSLAFPESANPTPDRILALQARFGTDPLTLASHCAATRQAAGVPQSLEQRPRGWQTEDISDAEFQVCQRVAELWAGGSMAGIPRFVDPQVEAAGEVLRMFDGDVSRTLEAITSYFEHYEADWQRSGSRPFSVVGPQSLVNVLRTFDVEGGYEAEARPRAERFLF